MTITSSPPIRTSPTEMTVFSGLNVRLASLYGSVIRTHLLHAVQHLEQPRIALRGRRRPRRSPCAARRVDRCTSNPISTSCAIDPLHLLVGRPFLHHHNHDDLRFTSEFSVYSA